MFLRAGIDVQVGTEVASLASFPRPRRRDTGVTLDPIVSLSDCLSARFPKYFI